MSLIVPFCNISRGSLHDGPGVRTVVYVKGCGMYCRWCHNPETISAKRHILYIRSKCIHCGKCTEVCPEHHIISGGDMEYISDGCTACGRCAEICPAMALTLCGDNRSCEDVFEEIKKDRHYYSLSGGGVTFYGGECLLYPEFVSQVARMCRDEGIHTAVESAFFVPWANIEMVLPYVDLFFADLKIPDSEKHLEYTGQPNERIIDNISALSRVHNNIIIRIPVIPGVNDSQTDMCAFGDIIKSFGDGIKGVELLRYNNLAESKYSIAGMDYVRFGDRSQTDIEMKKLCGILGNACYVNCYVV